jgi:hypothetical protein
VTTGATKRGTHLRLRELYVLHYRSSWRHAPPRLEEAVAHARFRVRLGGPLRRRTRLPGRLGCSSVKAGPMDKRASRRGWNGRASYGDASSGSDQGLEANGGHSRPPTARGSKERIELLRARRCRLRPDTGRACRNRRRPRQSWAPVRLRPPWSSTSCRTRATVRLWHARSPSGSCATGAAR